MNPDKPIKKRWLIFLSYFAINGSIVRKGAKDFENAVQRELTAFEIKAKALFEKNGHVMPAAISPLIIRAIRFRKQKALVKDLVAYLVIPWLVLSVLFFPIWLSFKSFGFCTHYNWGMIILIWFIGILVIILFSFLTTSVIQYFTNIESRITRLGSRICAFVVFAILHGLAWVTYSHCENIFLLFVFMGVLGALIIIDGAAVLFVISQPFVDLYYFSKKVTLTDELILESSYTLASYTNWQEIFRKRNKRNLAIAEIERLAGLLENDWSSHIKVGDERNEHWKKTTLKGIAFGIRKLKREVIIPSPGSAQMLSDRFNLLFEHLLNHNLQGFIQEDTPAERVRKKSPVRAFKQIIVALIPIAGAVLIYRYSPDLLPENYKGLPMIIGSGWLLLCLLLWLDPQLGEKISVLKSGKSIFSGSSDENSE